MTQRRALGDLDFDSAFDDPDNGWFGHVRAGDPASSRDHHEGPYLPPGDPQDAGVISAEDTDRWPVLTVDATPAPQADAVSPDDLHWDEDLPDRRPTSSWESRLSGSGAWDFKVQASGSGFRSKFAVAAMIAAGIAVAGVVLLLRSPSVANDESTVLPPQESTAQPAPTSSAPVLSTPSETPPPPGPPGPPPPPPPSAEEISPPVVTRDYTPRRQNAPDDSDKPEIGVTRAPTTRTQMSATPPPPPPSGRNSATPGDGRGGGGFGFGF